MESKLLNGIHWLGHASFRIEDKLTIYIDPWELKGNQPRADLVLITHCHYDHLSPADVKKIAGPDTVVVAPADCEAKLRELLPEIRFETATPGGKLIVRGIEIETPPAYNANKQFHTKDSKWVGYRIQLDGRSIYHTGDTDNTPELRAVKTDVLLVPVGGTYTMTAEEAAEAAHAIGPQMAVPMHWGKIVGSIEDAHMFKAR